MSRKILHFIDYKNDLNKELPVVVMIRGLGRSIDHWRGFDQRWAPLFRVISIENRGVGYSGDSLPWSWSLNDMSQDIIDVLDALQIQDAHFIGVSLGGMCALNIGRHYPSRTKTICAVNSSAGLFVQRLSLKGMGAFLKIIAEPHKSESLLAPLLLNKKERTHQELETIIDDWNKIQQKNPKIITNVLKQLLAAQKFWPVSQLQTINKPTLIVASKSDNLVPYSCSFKIHKSIPQSRFELFEEGGHELFEDQPQKLTELYKSFVYSFSGL